MDIQVRLALLNQPVVVEPFLATDGRGAASYGPPRTLSSYITGEQKMVRNLDGEEVISHESLFFDATPEALAIRHKDRITLPDGRRPPIIAIQSLRGEGTSMDVVEVSL